MGDASIADQGLLWRRYGKPAVHKAGISKRVGWHTFRHSYTTLLKNNGEDIKVVQELLRHANARVTMDVYAQAMMPAKRAGRANLFVWCSEMASKKLRPLRSMDGRLWTFLENVCLRQGLEKNGGDDGTRTRGLCRDSLGTSVVSATYILSGGCQLL